MPNSPQTIVQQSIVTEFRPIYRDAARTFINANHRHNKMPPGWLCGVGLWSNDQLIGVGMLGRPTARAMQDGFTAEITRTCTLGEPNACSRIYGTLCRAAQALGYRSVITYTLADEPGSSLKASGFIPEAEVDRKEWDCPSRPRKLVAPLAPKVRWRRRFGVS